jgi:hypothetical protein
MRNLYVNMVRRAIRDEATLDIEQMSSSLVAVTDPTASSFCFFGLRLLENSSVKSALPPLVESLHSDAACPTRRGPLSGRAAVAVHW